ncbi:MAG: Uma2 family endonuclease [Planctomycetaceae bacterium]
MSALVTSSIATTEFPVWPLRRFSVAEYRRWTQAGRFAEDDNFELLEGWIVENMPKNPPHDSRVTWAQSLLQRELPAGWHCCNQCSLETSDSVPKPDLAIVRGGILDYADRHPTGVDTALVIEVADTSLGSDREKRRLYARAGIREYWIINLVDSQIEVFRGPLGSGREADYSSEQSFSRSESLTLSIPGEPSREILVTALVP